MSRPNHGIIAANVTEQTADLWTQFRRVANARGMSYTKALEHAATLWLDSEPVTDPVVSMALAVDPTSFTEPVMGQPLAPAAAPFNPFAVQPQQDTA